MKVTNIKVLRRKIQKMRDAASNPKETHPMVQVGYTQSYAVHVHEIQARHKAGKQWKYLEAPARSLASTLVQIVKDVVRQTGSLRKGLLLAGLRLQRESQKIVPIDTAALKASAYTAYEEEADAAAAAARSKSDQLKAAVLAKRAKSGRP